MTGSHLPRMAEALATPSDTAETFRLGGMVETDNLVRGGASVAFRLTDGSRSVAVSYSGLLPDLFAEGTGAIATGQMVDGVFRASEILAKHDEQYMPREPAADNPPHAFRKDQTVISAEPNLLIRRSLTYHQVDLRENAAKIIESMTAKLEALELVPPEFG